ncbi:MAG: GNAT family N-acetyltransferase [Lachnospiraceae bacterium]|nr:GNAT family N-acetyltransferase [Lachnospiraceae bacterium]
MAETITVIEKPEEITFEQIREVLWDANERNRRDGFYLSTASMPGEKLKERLGPDGKCFVALAHKDGADEPLLVGTISIRYLDRRRWYAKGRVADYMLAAVISSYQGKHINSMLAEKVFETAREAGCKVVELDTAVTNKHAIAVYKHQGFKLVSFKANPGGDHYSVIMAKWLGKCPFSDAYCKLRYLAGKTLVKLRYTPDKKKRFGI